MPKNKTVREAEFSKWFGKRIAALRERRGWTQPELANRARIAVTHVGQVERGQTCSHYRALLLLVALAAEPEDY